MAEKTKSSKDKSKSGNNSKKQPTKTTAERSNTRTRNQPEISETPECLVNEGYELHELIGEGSYSKVYRATSPANPGVNYAVKRYKIQSTTQKWIDRCLLREMRIACTVRHPSIVEAYAGIKSETEAFLIIQYAPNGSIMTYLRKLSIIDYVNERKVREWAFDLFGAVGYLHKSEICHRDIKCDNFLLTEEKKPLLTDFSFACMAEQADTRFDCMVGTICGTSVYLAPEVHLLKKGAKYEAKAVDVFACGISLYEMFVKVVPYRGRYKIRDPELVQRMENKSYTFPKNLIISDQAKSLINDMLEPTPRGRPPINIILNNKWFEPLTIKGPRPKPGVTTESMFKFRDFTTKFDTDRLKKLNKRTGDG